MTHHKTPPLPDSYLRFIFIKRFTALAWVKFESFCPQMGVMHCFCYWWCIMIVALHLKRADYRGFTEQARVTKGWNTGNLGANAFIFGGARQNYIQVRISKSIHALTTSWVNQVFIFSSSVFSPIICQIVDRTRQSKHCGFSIYIFDNSKSKSMVRLVRAEKMVLSGLVFARKIARMILI